MSTNIQIPNSFHTVESRPLTVLVRAKAANFHTTFPYSPEEQTPGFELPEVRHAEFSPTGDYFVSIEGDNCNAVIRNADDASQVVSTCGGVNDPDCPLGVAFATFSPRGTYLLAWARPTAGVNVPNLVIYRVKDGQRLAAFHQKTFHLDFWPSIQWSDDEAIAARSVTNTIHFFGGDALEKPPVAKLGIPGIIKFALSRGPAPYSIAAFLSGPGKGSAVKLAMYDHPDQGGKQLCFRSTFRADAVKFLWNSKGTACLAHVSTNIDSTGENYYGESFVTYMSSDGSVEKKVDLPKRGPVHDVAWSPTGLEFVVVYGNMPSCATMFDERCEFLFDFGTGSRNTLSFSPHGRFLALAGFGNLPGAVEFWDKNKMALVGKAYLPCTTMFSWSGCSRYFLAATTFPRLRVDNVIRIVRFDGKKIHEHAYGTEPLHQATFRPALRGVYADPKFTMDEMIGGPVVEVAASEGPGSGGPGEPKKSGVYRPPGSRGAAPSFTLNQQRKAGAVDKASFLASAASVGAGIKRDELEMSSSSRGPGKKVVPGMDAELMNSGPSKAALARKKKKERQAAAKAAAAATSSSAAQAKSNGSSEANGSSNLNAGKAEENGVVDSVESGEKIARKLRKKLRKIEELKTNKSDGKELSKDQLDKLASEADVVKELADLEKKIAQMPS